VDDWRKECVAMSQVYNNSLVTLAGPKASTAFSGFLPHRNLPKIPPFELKWHLFGDDKRFPLILIYQRNATHRKPEVDSVLRKRAWILHERLLTQRFLHFGSEMMYWECNSKARYEVLSYSSKITVKYETKLKNGYSKSRKAANLG
jgi:hypothetical protein